jgi:hypothetical protein
MITLKYLMLQKTGPYKTKVFVEYEHGDRVAVQLSAQAEDQDIRLEKTQLSFESTYITLASAASLKIVNRSDCIAKFRWMLFSSDEDEREFRQRHRADLEMEELAELQKLKVFLFLVKGLFDDFIDG